MRRLLLMLCMALAFGASACANEQAEEITTPQEVTGNTNEPTESAPTTEFPTAEAVTVKENKAAEVQEFVIGMCENREFQFFAENSLGKGLQNEVISMKERAALQGQYAESARAKVYGKVSIEKSLFYKAIWNEVTDTEEQKLIAQAADSGFIRIFNENGEEFTVLKSTNGAILKADDNIRYFVWFDEKEKPGRADDFCNEWYDGFAFNTKRLAYMVIDDNPAKSREELAYELMETYRQCSAALLPDNDCYFEELKIISLKSYDESDSNPDTLIGIITEDVLRFDVEYAVNSYNTDGRMPVGGWREGEGEYEGYMINNIEVEARRYEGKWYCTGMGNG